MTTTRRLQFVLMLTLTGAPLAVRGLEATSYGGWPALGFAIGLFLVAGRHHRWLAFVSATLVVGAAFTFSYNVPLSVGIPASLTVTAPAWLTYKLLTHGQSDGLRVDLVDNVRYHVVTAVSSAVSAFVAGLAVLALAEPDAVPVAMGMTFLAALTSQLVVLPLLVGTLGRPAAARPPELWAQRVAMLVTTLAIFWPAHGLPLMFLLFPPLAWAAIRATRRETHIQLFLVCLGVYFLTFYGRGPLAAYSAGWPEQLSPILVYVFVWAACYLIVPLTLTVEQLFAATSRASRAATTVQRLVDSATQTIFVATDEHHAITHYSSGAQQALGYDPAAVMGCSPVMFHSQVEIARHAAHFGVPARYEAVVVAQSASSERRDWAFRHRDGSERMVSLGLSEITDDSGRLIGHIAAGEDITERLRAERALAAALAHEQDAVLRLKEVDQVKEELISNVSHELRTPITSISGYTELLIDGALGDLNPDQVTALERIERNSDRLSLLVEDLLTMSRSEAGQLVLEQEELDLCTVAKDALLAVEGMLSTRQVDVHLSLPTQPACIVGDRHALERVAVNLLSNAIKFTPDGGRIRLAVEVTRGVVALIARDNGIGISAEDQRRLFTRFFRAPDASERAIQGTGLGLSIVHALVTQHGGTVEVDSAPGVGTTVTALFPTAA